ncbi:MAG: heparan-alpha-glucosaminide N-acetyltransferase [Candidatus Norongarragalinales archaeon]
MRLWKVDFARGCAVVAMVLFNWLFALDFFGLTEFDASQGFWWAFARITGGAFVLIAGVSLWLSCFKRSRAEIALRGLKVFCLGLGITAATALFLKQGAVVFGILHSIGVSTILGIAFLGWSEKRLLVFSLLAVLSGAALSFFSFGFPWLLWLGLQPAGFYTLDYFPLLPWFGVFTAGVALGKKVYPARAVEPRRGPPAFARSLVFLGRHSLGIYLAHQPLLVVVLYAFGLNPLGF